MISILNLAEQCSTILGEGNLQGLIQSVKNAFAVVVKRQWYEGRNDGVNEINGSFLFTFNDIKPVLDAQTEQYYIEIPSSYLETVDERGINHVSFMKGSNKPFIRLSPGALGLISGLRSYNMGGNQVYSIEGTRMYFPKMKKSDVETDTNVVRGLLLKMALAFDTADVDANLNISPNIGADIVKEVVNLYQGREDHIDKTLA